MREPAAAPPLGQPSPESVSRARDFLERRFSVAGGFPLMVFCDFDGTISQEDLCYAVLDRFGAPEWREIEDRWLRGEIASTQTLPAQFASVRAPREELEAFCLRATLAEGFKEFARFLASRSAPLVVLSDGLDFYISLTLRRLGLENVPFAANSAAPSPQGVLVTFPHSDASCHQCGVCKCAFVEAGAEMAEERWYIGDGLSDWCASRRAERTHAKDSLLRLRRRFGPPAEEFDGFPALREEAERVLEARGQRCENRDGGNSSA